MSNLEDAANKSVARSIGESSSNQCLRCGAAVIAACVSGPGATARANWPCGCHAPVREVNQSMVLEIECEECGIARVIHDDPQYIGELAEMHEEEYGHDVELTEVDDE